MRSLVYMSLAVLVSVCTFPCIASAQLPAPNQAGVSVGHLHYSVHDLETSRKFWIALGGQPSNLGEGERAAIKFPGFFVYLSQRDFSGNSEGSVVDHVGFRVMDAKATREKMKALGYQVKESTGAGGGSIYTPDGERLELFQGVTENVRFIADDGRKNFETERNNRELTVPFALHHIHFYLPESEVLKIQKWYVENFGAIPGTRFHYAAADVPGVNLNFLGVAETHAPTKGRALDHSGFEIKGLQEFCRKLGAKGVKLDAPYKKNDSGRAAALLTDPWGTNIELTEGLSGL